MHFIDHFYLWVFALTTLGIKHARPPIQLKGSTVIVNTGVVHCKDNKKPSLNEPHRKKEVLYKSGVVQILR